MEVYAALIFSLGCEHRQKAPLERRHAALPESHGGAAFKEKIVRAGSAEREVLRLRRQDGTPLPASLFAIAVRGPGGTVITFGEIVEDIAWRKATEREILLQKAYLEHRGNTPAAEAERAIVQAVREHTGAAPHQDDMTAVLITRLPGAGGSPRTSTGAYTVRREPSR